MEEFGNFKGFLAAHKERVYKKICEYMPSDDPIFMGKVMRCYVDRKGQYRRPGYLLLWAALYGGDIEEAILPAAVQQISEDWILMHDDIIDNNSLRRGGPSAHVMFGTEYAIVGGDALHAVMWRMVNDSVKDLSERGTEYFRKEYDIISKTLYGQYLDVRLGKEYELDRFSEDDYYNSIHRKSAYYSVYGPMQCGAIIAGKGDKATMDKVAEYGTYAGYAFQIKDDILDCTSTETKLGKSIGNDVREGTKTLILYHTVQNANASTLGRLKSIYSRKSKTDEDVRFVLDTFDELGSIKYAQEQATNFANKAVEVFERLETDILESNLKRLARDAIGYVANRTE